MRMLFKWAIPWSDRVYNAFSHVKPALCRAAAQRQGTRSSLGRSGLPPRPPPGGQRGPASPPAAQDRRRNFAKSRECPQRDSSLKKQHYFAFAVKSLSLCTISFDVSFDAQKGKNCNADHVVIYQQNRCSHHSPMPLLYRAKHYMEMISSFSALLFHMKN